MSVSLSPCSVPGQDPSFTLGKDEMELGLGWWQTMLNYRVFLRTTLIMSFWHDHSEFASLCPENPESWIFSVCGFLLQVFTVKLVHRELRYVLLGIGWKLFYVIPFRSHCIIKIESITFPILASTECVGNLLQIMCIWHKPPRFILSVPKYFCYLSLNLLETLWQRWLSRSHLKKKGFDILKQIPVSWFFFTYIMFYDISRYECGSAGQ